jgi:hypothetical protein
MVMFFCDKCADNKGWKAYVSIFGSFGPCEVCGKYAQCSDVPSNYLPMPRAREVKPTLDIDSIT